MRLTWTVILLYLGFVGCSWAENARFWNDQAQDTLQKALSREASLNRNVAKNIVFFVGDGMGVSTVTGARIFKGQQAGRTGEETVLAWEKFSSIALSKTYNTDQQVPDSAATATAFFCGVKAKRNAIGVDDTATAGDCRSSLNATVESIMIDAEKEGKATGFVTTTRVTHATPASLYAHSPQRDWESNQDIPEEEAALGCTDIAHQLVTLGKNTKVIMGGGRREMIPNNFSDYEYPLEKGQRTDGRNLIDEWLAGTDNETSHFVWNLEQFNDVDPEKTEYLLGLFETSHMQYESERTDEPSIAQMTEKAIQILQRDKEGFFLMVEAGRIDHAHHQGIAGKAFVDTVAFEAAVAKAIEMTDEEDTLVIVTADHSHVMTMGGYASRGNPVLGLSDLHIGYDDLPYTTISYANGPGGIVEQNSFNTTGKRRNLTDEDTRVLNFVQPATIPLTYESHSMEDVAIYANGPMSHLFHGVHEQNYIAHVVRYAACLGDKKHCQEYVNPCGDVKGGSGTVVTGGLAVFSVFVNVWTALTFCE
ncbi:alkaline phosphatase-like isoform X2 [Acanthaster planci]|uniref:Alkaline phosphatase n=1 Tax=Acanthaster planci TaxID=133434 RepID=A0A8B7ZLJ5_ACAPL|nr:alkaline phosphatase-like isoform X2 [Acanthaster planci]